MSVINQMLQDLERRRASGQERQRIPDHVRALPDGSPAPAGSRMTMGLLAIAAVFGLSAVFWWWGRAPGSVNGPRLASPPVAPAGATAAAGGRL